MPTTPRFTSPLLLFDGVCNLCNATVAWIIRHDRDGTFRFDSLQSAAGRVALDAAGFTGELPESLVLIDEAGVHTRSDAVIRVACTLGLPWSIAGLARIIPRAARDWLYDEVARRRYRWFG